MIIPENQIQQEDNLQNYKIQYLQDKLQLSKKNTLKNTIKYSIYALISLIAWILSGSLYISTKDYKFEINKRAFNNLNQILLVQIPNFNCINFVVVLPLIAFYIYKLYQYSQIKADEIQYKYNDNDNKQKDCSNFILSYLLIYLTLGLSICLSITFCFKAIEESNSLIDVYKKEFENETYTEDSDQIEEGMKIIDDLSSDKALMITIIVFNMFSFIGLFVQSVIDGVQTCKSKKKKKT